MLRSPRRRGMALLLSIVMLAAAGCGSDDCSAPAPTPTATVAPTPTLRADSFFAPIPPPLSPDNANHLGPPRSGVVGRASAASTTPAFDHWFYLVNGAGIPMPATNFTPNVLMANGSAPDGAPAPNGGTGVGVAPLNADSTSRQIWKAIAGTQSGYYFLRSALSFDGPSTNGYSFNLLTGAGPAANALDLGYLSTYNTSIYWNQSASPTGDNSGFQQWAYDTSNAQLSNFTGGQLYNSSPTAGVDTDSTAPGNQWYAYPNYYIEQVVAQPDSDPPFPAFPIAAPTSANTAPAGATPTPTPDASGEQDAYDYLNEILLDGAMPTCTYNGTAYTGIRCEYANLSATSTLDECASYCLVQATGDTVPSAISGTVSLTDWTAVTWQIYQECSFAAQVQTTFNAYNQLMTDVFVEDGDLITNLASDVGVSASQSINAVALDVIEGILYTLLGATGDPAAGVAANLMSMSVNTALAAGGDSAESLTQEITAEVSQLYAQLGTAFQVLTDQSANGETAILTDWGRLQLIGPLTEITGYNGLGLTSTDVSNLQAAATKGYSLAVMQELMPIAYESEMSISLLSDEWDDVPTYAEYAYYTFGSNLSNYNTGYLQQQGDRLNQYPSQTVMETDIIDNGGNLFELFNALDGWSALPLLTTNSYSCYGNVVTLYNATPVDLWVTVTAPQGYFAAPGVDYDATGDNSGSTGPVTFELRPYGYLPLWSVVSPKNNYRDMTIDVEIFDYAYSTTDSVASFNYGSDGCHNQAPIGPWDIDFIAGYGFYPSGFELVNNGAMYVTVTN